MFETCMGLCWCSDQITITITVTITTTITIITPPHIVPPTMTSCGLDNTSVQILSETLLLAQQPVTSMYELSYTASPRQLESIVA